MRIHHLNCISTCPLGGKLMDGRTESIVRRGQLACHCLLVETGASLVLVDTGLGLRDVADPQGRLSAFFLGLLSPAFREEMTAVRQVERLGYDPRDVRHIVLTHLDFDHAGGLDDFPHAAVHMMAIERDYAMAQKTWLDRQRFRPQQWSTRGNWRVYSSGGGESWFGFERVRPLEGVPPEVVMVPLVGHTHGHAGVAVQRGGRWLLQAGDAYFFHAEMDPERPRCTPGLRLYQWMMQKDRASRLHNQRRLRELNRAHSREVSIFCGHDITEFERLAGRPARVPPTEAVVGVFASVAEAEQAKLRLAESGVATHRIALSGNLTEDGIAAEAPGQSYEHQAYASDHADSDWARYGSAVRTGACILSVASTSHHDRRRLAEQLRRQGARVTAERPAS